MRRRPFWRCRAELYTAAVQVRVLGAVELLRDSGEVVSIPGSNMRGLIALLALDAGHAVSPERIVNSLWAERVADGTNVMHVTVSKLRRLLAGVSEPDCIVTGPGGYLLRIAADDVDALRFEALISRARQASDAPALVADVLGEAVAMWRGPPLGGVPDTDAMNAARSRLEELQRGAVEDLVDAQLARGDHRRLVAEVEAHVAAEPLRERRWAQLIRALYGSGRQAEALRAFGRARDRLIDEIGVEPGPELRRLEAAVLAHDASVLGAPGPSVGEAAIGDDFRRSGNIRYPISSCVGRADDVAALPPLLGRHRLVTLTGPGGVGKTRLAQEASIGMKDNVPDGVWWVELASARSESDAVAAVQRALRMDSGSSDAAAALSAVTTVLSNREAVLVLDNCEHLLGAIASTVEELLGRCGNVRILATSREGFGIPAEVIYPVGPLAPADAIELFEARLTGQIEVTATAADEIEEICERLDRLPLALELAAARTRHLRLADILARLTDRFDLLRDGSRTAPEHQQNLRAVAAWSYGLLDDAERTVFERLSVFADGATLSAARHVCAAHGVIPEDVERVIERLIDKSLVVADRAGPQTRFRMLQTLGDYARECLDTNADRENALRAHAAWVRALAASVRFGSRVTGETVAAIQDEDVAIQDAIRWTLVADPVLGLEICDDLAPFWFGTMRVSVGWELLSAALDAAGRTDLLRRSSALSYALLFATMVQDLETAERLTAEAFEYEEALGDPARLGRLSFAAALAASYRHIDDVDVLVDQARQHFITAKMPIGLAHVSFANGAHRLMAGEFDGAAAQLLDAIAAFRGEGDHLGLILAVSRMGELAWRLDDMPQFARMHADLLELGRASRSMGVVTGATARLAVARLVEGDLDEAQALARAALATSGESFMPIVNGYAFRAAGLVNLRSGHVAEGRAQLNAAIEAFESGTGSVGVGQAALCWIDLSRSHAEGGEPEPASAAARRAVDLGSAAGDPWVLDQARANLPVTATPAALDPEGALGPR